MIQLAGLFDVYNGADNHVHLKRWITGLIALPFLIFLVYIGGFPFIVLVGFACICSLWEFYRIVFNDDGDIFIRFSLSLLTYL